MNNIKLKNDYKIKKLQKAKLHTKKIKNTAINITKNTRNIENINNTENTINEYGINKITNSSKTIMNKGVTILNKRGKRTIKNSIHKTRNKISGTKFLTYILGFGGLLFILLIITICFSSAMFGSIGSENIVAVASSQIGNVGGEPYWSWYGFESRVDWCACFVSWCAEQCGYIEKDIIPKFANCQIEGVEWFMERELWRDKNFIPKSRRYNIF